MPDLSLYVRAWFLALMDVFSAGTTDLTCKAVETEIHFMHFPRHLLLLTFQSGFSPTELIHGTPSAGQHGHSVSTPQVTTAQHVLSHLHSQKLSDLTWPYHISLVLWHFPGKENMYRNSCVCLEFEYFAEYFFLENRPKKTNLESIDNFSLLENAFHFELPITKCWSEGKYQTSLHPHPRFWFVDAIFRMNLEFVLDKLTF